MSENHENKDSLKEETTAQEEVQNDQQAAVEPEMSQPEGGQEEDGAVSQKQLDELKDKYLRLMAEFENYKRRTVREKMDLMKNAAQDTMSALLPVLDDFDRARKAADQNDKGNLFEEGIGLVYKKLYDTLKHRGLEPMVTDGEPFDPEMHEALTEIPAPSEEMKGKIMDTVEKGYRLNDKIIRHAKVVVGK